MTSEAKQKVHYTEKYCIDPQHPITICLIGLGGNGSSMLSNLARIHMTLLALEHPGLFVHAYDPDTVSEANIGRQLFSEADLGRNKAHVLIERINRFFGLGWSAHPHNFPLMKTKRANMYITCVDTLSARKKILKAITPTKYQKFSRHEERPYYWLDLGNSSDIGQYVLKSLAPIFQPSSEFETVSDLPGLFDVFPKLRKKRDDKNEPSCSLAESIEKQDLFINSAVALNASVLIWKMFREARLDYHGGFVNLANGETNKLML